MSLSRKYGRTFHYPFSPGTTSDDRIHHNYWEDVCALDEIIHTEKMDGENTCLNKYGVFARSHAAPTRHPWAGYLKERWQLIKNELKNLEFFGENIYAIHSIQYPKIENHFYVFAIRELDQWLSWEEVRFYAALIDFPTVPELGKASPDTRKIFEEEILNLVNRESTFQSVEVSTNEVCTMEGLVSRNVNGFSVNAFKANVFKYVRKNHVQTDEHWTRNWKRAPLVYEQKKKQ